MRWTLVSLLVAALVVTFCSRPDDPPPVDRPAGRLPATAPQAAAAAPEPARTPAATAPAFASEQAGGQVLAGTSRNGLAVVVLGHDGAPRPHAPITVAWRQDHGRHGRDRGATDAAGRFATTVPGFELLRRIEVDDAELGGLVAERPFLPLAHDPHTVAVLVPALHPLAVQLLDQDGRAIAGGTVACTQRALDRPPRAHVLARKVGAATTDAGGRVMLALPAGSYELHAEAPDHEPFYVLRVAVPPGGCSVAMHLLGPGGRHDVHVTVAAPADLDVPIQVRATCDAMPPSMPGLDRRAIEPVPRELPVRAVGPREFVVAAPMLPFCVSAGAAFCESAAADVGPSDLDVVLTLQRASPRARARLHCRLLLPDGRPTAGEVMVHTEPDLVFGARHRVGVDDPVVTIAPVARACVSGWVPDHPPVVVGPLELTAGDHEIVLLVPRPRAVRGRVVDAHGRPVPAWVTLRRPAGPLQALAAGAPPMLAESAVGDGFGTSSDGRFAFETLGPGEHELHALPWITGWPARKRVLPGEHDVVLTLGEGLLGMVRVHGRITHAGTGHPVAGARVRWCGDTGSRPTDSDADGRYAMALLPGTAQLVVFARGCAVLLGDERVLAAGEARVDAVLHASEPLPVRVRDRHGAMPDVELAVFDARGRQLPLLDADGDHEHDVAVPDATGRVLLYGLPAAPLRLRLTRGEGTAVEVQEIALPADLRRDREFDISWRPGQH